MAVFAILATAVSPVAAFDVPGAFQKNINDPGENVPVIIETLSYNALNSEDADKEEVAMVKLKQKAIAAAYAEAFTMRTNLQKQADKNAAEGKKKSGHKTEVDLITQESKRAMRSIAERINSIMSLEAALANMEGTVIITSLPKDGPGEKEEKDTSAATEGEAQ